MEPTFMTAAVATFLLAAVFVQPWPREVIGERTKGFRSFVSFAAGISLAYVFIDLLPEMSGLGDELLEEAALPLLVPEYFVYLAALAGFILFYGLERLVRWHRPDEKRSREGADAAPRREDEEAEEAEERIDYRIKLFGLAAYAALILYLMTAGIREGSEEGLVAYVIAMLFHFVATRHGLRFEFPEPYMRHGRWVMAAACLGGAALGFLAELPLGWEALFLGFLGGMLIMNTTVMELPSEKEGRFGMFALGAGLYAALLMIA